MTITTICQVLDHGFVKLRNISGPTRRTHDSAKEEIIGRSRMIDMDDLRPFDADDTDPANSARISFDNLDEDRTREQDLKLCGYLMQNWHTSPFEMIEIWLEMKLPIFVARQFVRHRTVSINEVSGRYVQLPKEWYIPEIVGGKPKNAKQGQENTLSPVIQSWFKARLERECDDSYQLYEKALSEGVAAEHARMALHLNHYTHWLWKQDLHNMMHFLALRDDSHAQIEAQLYGQAIDGLIRAVLPESMALYDKWRKINARRLLEEKLKKAESLLREALSDYGARNFTDRRGMADRLREYFNEKIED